MATIEIECSNTHSIPVFSDFLNEVQKRFYIEKEAKLQAMVEASWAAHNERKNQPAQPDSLTWSDCYNSNSKGYMGSQYCGD